MPSTDDRVEALLGELSTWTIRPAPSNHLDGWAMSGAMHLTGHACGPPLRGPGDIAGTAQLLLDIWSAHTSHFCGDRPDVRILAERAAVMGLTRTGPVSCGGSTRLLPASDGYFVLTLARPEDIALVPALIQAETPGDPWDAVTQWGSDRGVEEIDSRIALLGLPGGAVPGAPVKPERPAVVATGGITPWNGSPVRPRVLDLSSLWAGPLCAHLLGLTGADVVKVESASRPDGSREGSRRFFDRLHGGHRSVVLDFADAESVGTLRRLAETADVVIESSRPRALAALGLEAARLVEAGTTWVSITARGRTVEGGHRVGFGDDIAASAGLIARSSAGPTLCGDAIADPLAGLAAAAAVCVAMTSGRAWLLDVSMRDVCLAAASAGPPALSPAMTPARPFARPSPTRAADPGEHTASVVREWLS